MQKFKQYKKKEYFVHKLNTNVECGRMEYANLKHKILKSLSVWFYTTALIHIYYSKNIQKTFRRFVGLY